MRGKRLGSCAHKRVRHSGPRSVRQHVARARRCGPSEQRRNGAFTAKIDGQSFVIGSAHDDGKSPQAGARHGTAILVREPDTEEVRCRYNLRFGMPENSLMPQSNHVLSIWNRLASWPLGKWLFSRLVCFRAPYFGSVRPLFLDLRPGSSLVRVKLKRRVKNHIGTLHAIAMCNAAELAAGTMVEASLPPSHRWIPKGMVVEYLKPAHGDVVAAAQVALPAELEDAAEIPIEVDVTCGELKVMRATIAMWVSRKKN